MCTSDGFTAPELLKMLQSHGTTFESVITTPEDVYSLVLVLWAVAEDGNAYSGVARREDPKLVQRYCQTVSCFGPRGQAVCHRGVVPFIERESLSSRKAQL